jgi:hypothetical protein
MHISHAAPAVRTHAPDLLDGMPDDILTHIVMTHISLREGRTLTSLASVSRAFAQWMTPHRKPLLCSRELAKAIDGAPEEALKLCMGALYDLAEANPAHRLELFLRISATLHHHFRGTDIEPHVNTLLASMAHLAPVDQPAALLSLLDTHGTNLLCATKPGYLDMAGRIGGFMPSVAQSRLSNILGSTIAGLSGQDFADRAQAFLRMCRRLQPAPAAEAISHLLERFRGMGEQMLYPGRPDRYDDGQMRQNKLVLLWGLHDCLQSIPMQELPVERVMLLLARAMVMPDYLPDDADRDKMAISLLRMIPEGNHDLYRRDLGEAPHRLDLSVERMLLDVFERGSRQSIHRFQRLYQAMAHLPPSFRTGCMCDILYRCARQAEPGVTPALIIATAQAALPLKDSLLTLLHDLFALCLTPAPRRATSSPHLEPAKVAPLEQAAYMQRFDANCAGLMHLLRDAAPDAASELLFGINGAYRGHSSLKNILPPLKQFSTELYGCFLKHALALLQTLPPADRAACLLQWRLPSLCRTDARHADNWTSLLLTAVAEISRDTDLVSLEQQETVLGELLENGIDVQYHSPARNRRLLAGLAAFPDVACAKVLVRLLVNQQMSFAHGDVLFASIIEAAYRLPDVLRSSVLERAADRLNHFPKPKLWYPKGTTLQQQREFALEDEHAGLEESDPDLYAAMRPGQVSRTEGWTLLLDAVETLPAPYQADRFRQLCKDNSLFDFSNIALSDEEKAQCSLRLLSSIIRLPNAMRAGVFSSWLKHVGPQFHDMETRVTIQAALLPMLLALPASEGKPLFDAYLATIWSAAKRAELQQRAALHWKDAV